MAGEEKENELKGIDKWFNKLDNYFTGKIAAFVAFLFFLFTVGAVFGAVSVWKLPGLAPYIIMVPAFLGLIAYYSRGFATLMFIAVLLIILV